eukprot:6037-Heterococcus_DN1.PRE.3
MPNSSMMSYSSMMMPSMTVHAPSAMPVLPYAAKLEFSTGGFAAGLAAGSSPGVSSGNTSSSSTSVVRRSVAKNDQAAMRRERNRVLAKRTRLRKKFFFQSLQQQVLALHKENLRLRDIVQTRCGERGQQVLTECEPETPLLVTQCAKQATALLRRSDFLLMKALQNSQPSFCVCDPLLPDCPIGTTTTTTANQCYTYRISTVVHACSSVYSADFIHRHCWSISIAIALVKQGSIQLLVCNTAADSFLVFTNVNNTINTAITSTATTTAVYASDGFLALTGYTRQQVVGRNCRFLQGPDTDAATVAKLREGIAAGVDTSVFLRNFNSSGEPFWNHVFVACLKNAAGKVVNYVGIQHKLDKPPLDDILDQFVLPDITTTEDDESTAVETVKYIAAAAVIADSNGGVNQQCYTVAAARLSSVKLAVALSREYP